MESRIVFWCQCIILLIVTRVNSGFTLNETVNLSEKQSLNFSFCQGECTCALSKNEFTNSLIHGNFLKNSEVRDSNLSVITLCPNYQYKNCLPKDSNVCYKIYKNFKKLDLLSYLESLDVYRRADIYFLCLNNQNLSCLDPLFFLKLEFINAISVSRNRISNLNWTENLLKVPISYLDLSHNQIKLLEAGMFMTLKNLVWLNLRHNFVERIAQDALAYLPQLQFLDLSYNSISIIPRGIFENLSNLLWLSLSNNYKLVKLPNLEFIGLKDSKVEALDFHGIPHLTEISSYAFNSLKSLKMLNLSCCGIKDVSSGWLNGGPERTLEILDLSHNNFSSIKSNYLVSFEIATQNKYSDSIQAVDPNSLSYLISPRPSYASSAVVWQLDCGSSMHRSRQVEFYKPISSLTWLSFAGNPSLHVLEDNAFNFIPNLRYLFLENCNIRKIKIASTKFKFQKYSIAKTLPKLEGLWVSGNPLMCDCYVRELCNYVSSNCKSNSENTTDESQLFINPTMYTYKKACWSVENIQSGVFCYKSDLSAVSASTLSQSSMRCPQEPISMVVVMLIGPLTFVAAIIFMTICGYFAVTLSRFKRFKSGFYHTQSFQHRRSKVTKKAFVHKVKNNAKAKYSFTPQETPRMTYSTNLVLGKMSSPRTPRLQSSILPQSFLSPGKRLERKRSPSSSPRIHARNRVKHRTVVDSRAPDDGASSRNSTLSPSCSITPNFIRKNFLAVPTMTKQTLKNYKSVSDGDTEPFISQVEDTIFDETSFNENNFTSQQDEKLSSVSNRRNHDNTHKLKKDNETHKKSDI